MSREQRLIAQLKSWGSARLIPTLPESKKEEGATSNLLAAFKVLPTFASDMLREGGARIGNCLAPELHIRIRAFRSVGFCFAYG